MSREGRRQIHFEESGGTRFRAPINRSKKEFLYTRVSSTERFFKKEERKTSIFVNHSRIRHDNKDRGEKWRLSGLKEAFVRCFKVVEVVKRRKRAV